MSRRFVVLGLSTVRAVWPREVTGWAMSGALPLEFTKCISAEEVRARLRSGRTHSAVLVDASALGVDRDLFAVIHEFGAVAIVISSDDQDWGDLGANTQLHEVFSREDLLERLEAAASPVGDDDAQEHARDDVEDDTSHSHGRLIAVLGRGGSGVSTLAAAIAQSLISPTATSSCAPGGPAVLIDLARRADQAMLHDATDVVPGLQELVEAHRHGRLTTTRVRSMTFRVPARGYDLLLGRRRPSDWVTLRPRAFRSALEGLLDSYATLVADIDSDLEGEAECGSIDVEERNLAARDVTSLADAIVIVSDPTLSGVHRMVAMVDEVLRLDVAPARIVLVINNAPRSARTRSDLASSIAKLADGGAATELASPIFVGTRRHLDDIHRNGIRFPPGLAADVATAIESAIRRAPGRETSQPEPEPVVVGSLGFSESAPSAGES